MVILEGMSNFDGNNRDGQILGLPNLHSIDPKDQNTNRNAMAILSNFDFSKTQGISIDMALEYAQSLYDNEIDGAEPVIENVLRGVIAHHPDEFGPTLALAINTIGDEKTAKIVEEVLVRTNAQAAFLKEIQIEFASSYQDGILQLPPEEIASIALRGEELGIKPDQVRHPSSSLNDLIGKAIRRQ